MCVCVYTYLGQKLNFDSAESRGPRIQFLSRVKTMLSLPRNSNWLAEFSLFTADRFDDIGENRFGIAREIRNTTM